jgi:hypothetical protein
VFTLDVGLVCPRPSDYARASRMPSPAVRPAHTLALGVWLASRGPLAVTGFILAVVGAAISVCISAAFRRDGNGDIVLVPTLTSECIAWSSGVMVSLGAGFRAFHGDQEPGILALVRVRSAGLGEYIRGRVGGLILVLEAMLGGATVVAAIAALAAGGVTTPLVRACVGAVAYAIAFAAVIGPLTMACIAARTRVGGYVTWLSVLLLPELVSPWTATLLPGDWRELTSIPAALGALRACMTSPPASGARAARALAGLAAVFAVSVMVVGTRTARAAAEQLR